MQNEKAKIKADLEIAEKNVINVETRHGMMAGSYWHLQVERLTVALDELKLPKKKLEVLDNGKLE